MGWKTGMKTILHYLFTKSCRRFINTVIGLSNRVKFSQIEEYCESFKQDGTRQDIELIFH